MNAKSLDEAIIDLYIEIHEYAIKRLKEIKESWRKLPEEKKAKIELTSKLDPAELENLPWTRFLKDESGKRVKAKEGEPGWVMNPLFFKDLECNEAQRELARAIEKAGGRLEFAGYTFTFGGEGNRFIQRRPVKKENGTGSSDLKNQGGGLQPGEGQAASPPPEQGGSSR